MLGDMLPIGEPAFVPDDTIVFETGSAESLDTAPDWPVAVLWIPDPEQRHGWREHYVARRAVPKPGRPLGFRNKA